MDEVMEDSSAAQAFFRPASEQTLLPETDVTVTVSTAGGGGTFLNISEALAVHTQGTVRIIMSAGTYEEVGLELRDGIQIVAAEGCVPATDGAVVLTSRKDKPVVTSSAKGAIIRNLQVEHRGPFGSMACVVVEAGDLALEDCLITGSVSVGVLICGTATPTIDHCQVLRCCGDGIKVVDSAEPLVRGCELRSNDGFGIFCTGASAGVYRQNSISANSNAGVATRGTCSALFEDNKLFNGKQGGFWMEENSRCRVMNNDIYQNQKSGIQVGGHADPLVRGNIVRDGLKGGIVVHDHATGQFVQNEIMRNTMAGVGGTDYACPIFHSNIVKDGKGGGIVLHEHCKGVFEKNQVIGNTHAGIGLKGSSNALFDGNYVSDGSGYGVWVQERSFSTLQNNVRTLACAVNFSELPAAHKGVWRRGASPLQRCRTLARTPNFREMHALFLGDFHKSLEKEICFQKLFFFEIFFFNR